MKIHILDLKLAEKITYLGQLARKIIELKNNNVDKVEIDKFRSDNNYDVLLEELFDIFDL
jgi:hypothetical protein